MILFNAAASNNSVTRKIYHWHEALKNYVLRNHNFTKDICSTLSFLKFLIFFWLTYGKTDLCQFCIYVKEIICSKHLQTCLRWSGQGTLPLSAASHCLFPSWAVMPSAEWFVSGIQFHNFNMCNHCCSWGMEHHPPPSKIPLRYSFVVISS